MARKSILHDVANLIAALEEQMTPITAILTMDPAEQAITAQD